MHFIPSQRRHIYEHVFTIFEHPMRITFFVFIALYALVTACTGKKHTAEQYNNQLDSLNRNLSRGIIDTARVNIISKDITAYADKNPSDTAAPRLMFNLARAQQGVRQYDKSITTLREVRRRYPESEYASKALVLEGFIQANVTQKYDDARKAYTEYLDKYRNVDSNLTRSVELELQTMGKSPEELLQEFEARRKQDSLERLPQ
jgi:hypothetical protein